MLGKEGTTHTDSLVVLAEMSAHDGRFIHGYTEVCLNEIDGNQDGEIGIALAASGATHLGNLT